MESLSERLAAITAAQPFEVSWYVVDMRDGGEVHHRGEAPVPCAGIERLLLYLSCLRAVQRGQLDPNATVTYEERHRSTARHGVLRWMTPGLSITVGDALAQMVITGDSVGAALVREQLAARQMPASELVDGFCADAGLSSTRYGAPDGTTTAYDQARLVESLVARAHDRVPQLELGLDPPRAARAVEVMCSVASTTGITAHLPGYGPFNARVAHLACDGGDDEPPARNWADVGVVYQQGEPSYALAAFCTGVPETIDGLPGSAVTLAAIGNLSAACWHRGQSPSAQRGTDTP
ncbi:MAG: serine hydrolase [Streptosporangiales bacterium]